MSQNYLQIFIQISKKFSKSNQKKYLHAFIDEIPKNHLLISLKGEKWKVNCIYKITIIVGKTPK